jgi:hypothetical protein
LSPLNHPSKEIIMRKLDPKELKHVYGGGAAKKPTAKTQSGSASAASNSAASNSAASAS